MADFQMTPFIISILFVGLIITGVSIALTSFASEYGLEYDNESLAAYNNEQEMQSMAEDLRDSSAQVGETSTIDVIGGYITQGYNSLTVTKTSVDSFTSMANDGIDDLSLGAMGSSIKGFLINSIVIIVFLGILVSAIMKWRL